MRKVLLGLLISLFFINLGFAKNTEPLILFYGETCPHCKAEEGYLEELKNEYDFEVIGYEVYYSQENQEKMQEYADKFGTTFNGVPIVIMGSDYFMGADYDKTVNLLKKYAFKKTESLDNQTYKNKNEVKENDSTNKPDEENKIDDGKVTYLSGDNVSLGTGENFNNEKETTNNDNPEDQMTKLFGMEISLQKTGPIVFGGLLGFADGINPCMFGVLIFLLTYLISVGSRKKVLYSGLIFVVTTFVLYATIMYLMHKLIFSTMVLLPYIPIIKYVIGGLAIFLGLLEIKDFFRYGKGLSLAIPKRAKPTLEYITKKGTYMSAFVLAVLSTFVELPCTIGIPLAYIGAVGTKINIFIALGIYNFFFILPLIIIIFGIYYGIGAFKTKDGDLAVNNVSNKKIMRLMAGIILLVLGILFLTKIL